MFVLTALVYPCVLALLCTGAGLLIDRAGGGWLPGMLLPAVGAAMLIAVSQLTTYATFMAPATPYAFALVAMAGLALGWGKLTALAHGWRRGGWRLSVGPLAYAIALAPMLVAGRPTFSSFQALTDSAVHMLGADYLMRHGQAYAHLDLRNSYGQYVKNYYGTSYPSGADTLFGGSASMLGLPLIWTLQPFSAFMLALATGPAWMLARRMRLAGGWAALAAVSATVPALVYGYELVASVKEIVALPMILTLGVLAVVHERWLWRRTGVMPFAVVLAAGVSALGVGFGAWGLAAVAVVGVVAVRDVWEGGHDGRQLLGVIALGAALTLICALGTWTDLAGSLHVAKAIATTSNPGNLGAPLRPVQALGTWLSGSYQWAPRGALLTISYAIAVATLIAAVAGAARTVYLGEYALAGWFALIVAVDAGLIVYATTWVNAKTIMLSSPVVVLLAWGGIAGMRAGAPGRVSRSAHGPAPLTAHGPAPQTAHGPALRTARRSRRGPAPRIGGILLALLIAGGIGVSDAMQYHTSNLAPTQRYEELASIDAKYAGRGPVLFVGFDEYALYVLRDLDVGGVEFIYPPAGLQLTPGHGSPVDLDHVPPAALVRYPLIITRRDPTVSEPPSAYRLAWQGVYYQVWQRRPGAPAAIVHLGLTSTRPVQCSAVRRLARIAGADGARLIAARAPETVMVDLADARHPTWKYTHPGLELSGAGRLEARFALPSGGPWDVWLKGQLMPAVNVQVDGRTLGSIGGQLDGNPHNPSMMQPLHATLAAGEHRLAIVRGSSALAPGEGGWAILHEVVLTPADRPDVDTLEAMAPARWQDLCGRRFDWIEVTRG